MKTAVANKLDVQERKAFRKHEQTIEEGKKTFVEVGNALAAIRDEKLYRESHKTFEAYTKERWGYAKSRAYQLIEAAVVVSTIVDESDDADYQVVTPTNEAQARVLADVPAEERAEVLAEAAERSDGKATAASIREVIAEREEEAEEEPTTEAAMKAEASALESWCRSVTALMADLPQSKWLDKNRRDTIEAQLKTPCATVRAAKGVGLCPCCKGNGCGKCKQTGWMPKIEFESNGGKK